MNFKCSLAACMVAVLAAGCCSVSCPSGQEESKLMDMTAKYTPEAIKIDGVLDDAAWQTASVYKLERPVAAAGKIVAGEGYARLAWDDKYFYVGVEFQDEDIYAMGERDQMMHWQFGDLAEVFIKPETDTYYWELYCTPKGKKSSFISPGHAFVIADFMNVPQIEGMKTAATIQGTVNQWQDKDNVWYGEFAIPIQELEQYGAKFAPGELWRVLIARYNYSRYHYDVIEYSTAPQLSRIDYHLINEYANLRIEK